jgi:hypothetical protein
MSKTKTKFEADSRLHIVPRRTDLGAVPHNREPRPVTILQFACVYFSVVIAAIYILWCAAKAVR